MFPFNQELSFQAAGNPGEEEEAQDLNLDNELLAVVNLNTTTTSSASASTRITFSTTHLTPPTPAGSQHRRAQGDSNGGGEEGFDEDHDRMRKMQHRDIERQRRQEMSSLFSNLRTLLPHQYLKGKRSMSDHIDESANYIKNLQGRIKVLGDTRDRLTTLRQHESSTSYSTTPGVSHGSSHHSTTTIASSTYAIPNNVEVFMGSGGLQVQISSSQREDGPRLSTALKVLLEAGLDVVSCVTNKVSWGGLLHSIHCDLSTNMGQAGEIDVQQLQQRLHQVVCSDTWTTQLR